ncbi:MAG: TM2 domain-containing protein [Methanosphaera sp.]|nr:TM2 domain-containing protein [Methanosphaera sp.]
MVKCPECGYENDKSLSTCVGCGYDLTTIDTSINYESSESNDNTQEPIQDSTQVNDIPINNNQQQNYNPPSYQQNDMQQNPQYNQQFNQQQNQQYQQQYNPQYNQQYQAPNHKSAFLALILQFFVPGLGYVYIGKTRDGILVFVIMIILFILGFITLLITWLIEIVLWIYVLFDVYSKAKLINEGRPVSDLI